MNACNKQFLYICIKIKAIILLNHLPGSFKPKEALKSFLQQLTELEGYVVDRMEYNFISRERMLLLNRKHLNHDYDTDIITFDYTENIYVRAEFFVSIWAIEDSAKSFNIPFDHELLRVVIHGVLHCLGYDDKDAEQQAIIKEKENYYINMFHVKQSKHV